MFENDSEGDYTYIVYGNKKVYYDKDEADYFGMITIIKIYL